MLTKDIAIANNKVLTNIFWVSTFAVITAISAQVEIPVYPVPFTLQTFFVLLSGAVLGYKLGFFSMSFYLTLGIVGLPVFSGGSFGLWKILGPTGGYLISFPLAAFLVGYLIRIRSEYWWMLLVMLLGSLLIFLFGITQLYIVYFQNWGESLQAGFLIFTFWDLLKVVAAAAIAYNYRKGKMV